MYRAAPRLFNRCWRKPKLQRFQRLQRFATAVEAPLGSLSGTYNPIAHTSPGAAKEDGMLRDILYPLPSLPPLLPPAYFLRGLDMSRTDEGVGGDNEKAISKKYGEPSPPNPTRRRPREPASSRTNTSRRRKGSRHMQTERSRRYGS